MSNSKKNKHKNKKNSNNKVKANKQTEIKSVVEEIDVKNSTNDNYDNDNNNDNYLSGKPKRKTHIFGKILAIGLISIMLMPIVYSMGKYTYTFVKTEIYEPWKSERESENTDTSDGDVSYEVVDETHPIATVEIEGYGTLVYELYPEEAPETVNNFISLANSGFYDGTTCHRVVEDFMVQCGDPSGDGTGGPGYSIPGEMANNGGPSTLTHEEGALAMARSSEYDSAGSQFYTVTGEASNLDGEYTVFGYLIDGQEVLEELNTVEVTCETKECSTPVEPITITSVTVDTKGEEYPEPNKIEE